MSSSGGNAGGSTKSKPKEKQQRAPFVPVSLSVVNAAVRAASNSAAPASKFQLWQAFADGQRKMRDEWKLDDESEEEDRRGKLKEGAECEGEEDNLEMRVDEDEEEEEEGEEVKGASSAKKETNQG